MVPSLRTLAFCLTPSLVAAHQAFDDSIVMVQKNLIQESKSNKAAPAKGRGVHSHGAIGGESKKKQDPFEDLMGGLGALMGGGGGGSKDPLDAIADMFAGGNGGGKKGPSTKEMNPFEVMASAFGPPAKQPDKSLPDDAQLLQQFLNQLDFITNLVNTLDANAEEPAKSRRTEKQTSEQLKRETQTRTNLREFARPIVHVFLGESSPEARSELINWLVTKLTAYRRSQLTVQERELMDNILAVDITGNNRLEDKISNILIAMNSTDGYSQAATDLSAWVMPATKLSHYMTESFEDMVHRMVNTSMMSAMIRDVAYNPFVPQAHPYVTDLADLMDEAERTQTYAHAQRMVQHMNKEVAPTVMLMSDIVFGLRRFFASGENSLAHVADVFHDLSLFNDGEGATFSTMGNYVDDLSVWYDQGKLYNSTLVMPRTAQMMSEAGMLDDDMKEAIFKAQDITRSFVCNLKSSAVQELPGCKKVRSTRPAPVVDVD